VRGELKAYWRLARSGYRRQSQYRLAMFAGLFTNVVFGLVRASIMLAAVKEPGTFGGYDAGSVGAYVWLSQGLVGAIQIKGPAPELADRIKTGDVAIDFVRPIDVQTSYLAGDLGRAASTFLPRGLPSVIIGSLVCGLAMPRTAEPYVLGLISVVLAVVLSFLSQFAVAVTGFWLIETRGIRSLYTVGGSFLAGLYVPVHLFPAWLQRLANGTPFPSILQAPIDVLSGRVVATEAVKIILIQVVWVVIAATVGRLMLRAGRLKLEAQGG
jgi:ABC-2 type transport system permease protein